ncbi:hypothetical protein BJ969_003244 [Saccharopolyspora gloriosae]|uniref:Uncharacterized protein n=1 Tax=Saccharopolyspora gloriosae TaxID=455344 RepID=A0A840NCX2_9PSEU|nr:hypothetical protein [Saccharopolyspora gloriosae]
MPDNYDHCARKPADVETQCETWIFNAGDADLAEDAGGIRRAP